MYWPFGGASCCGLCFKIIIYLLYIVIITYYIIS